MPMEYATARPAPRASTGSFFGSVPVLVIAALCLISSWGTYRQFAPFVTLGTIPIFCLVALAPFGFLAFAGRTGLRGFDLLPPALAVLAALSLNWSSAPHSWGLTAFYYMACAGLYICCRLFVRSLDSVQVIVLAAGAGALIGTFMIEPIQTQWMTAETRSAVVGLNQNFTAYVFAGTVYLLLLYARHMTRNALFRVLAWVTCAVLAYNLVLLGTRGAMIALGLMFAWDIGTRLVGTQLAAPIAMGAAVLAVAFSFGALDWIGVAVEALFQRDSGNLSGRANIWEYARGEIWRHPILGIGAGSFQFVNPLQVEGHNYFLTAWLNLGLLGFVATLALLVAGFGPALSTNSKPSHRYTLGLFACYFLPIAATGNIELAPFAWVVMAVTFSLLRPSPAKAAGTSGVKGRKRFTIARSVRSWPPVVTVTRAD